MIGPEYKISFMSFKQELSLVVTQPPVDEKKFSPTSLFTQVFPEMTEQGSSTSIHNVHLMA